MNTLTRLAMSLSLMGLASSLPNTAIAAIGEKTPTKVTTETKQKASFLFVCELTPVLLPRMTVGIR